MFHIDFHVRTTSFDLWCEVGDYLSVPVLFSGVVPTLPWLALKGSWYLLAKTSETDHVRCDCSDMLTLIMIKILLARLGLSFSALIYQPTLFAYWKRNIG